MFQISNSAFSGSKHPCVVALFELGMSDKPAWAYDGPTPPKVTIYYPEPSPPAPDHDLENMSRSQPIGKFCEVGGQLLEHFIEKSIRSQRRQGKAGQEQPLPLELWNLEPLCVHLA